MINYSFVLVILNTFLFTIAITYMEHLFGVKQLLFINKLHTGFYKVGVF